MEVYLASTASRVPACGCGRLRWLCHRRGRREPQIDERRFLKESQYFKGWGFDYNLYRPILNFARAEGIPVVALNVEHGIVSKVFHSGLASLSPDEKAKIPAQLDFSDKVYEERLRKVFQEHKTEKEERFDYLLSGASPLG